MIVNKKDINFTSLESDFHDGGSVDHLLLLWKLTIHFPLIWWTGEHETSILPFFSTEVLPYSYYIPLPISPNSSRLTKPHQLVFYTTLILFMTRLYFVYIKWLTWQQKKNSCIQLKITRW